MATKLTSAQEHVLALAYDKKDLYGDCALLGDYGGRRLTVNALRKRKLIWSDGTLTEMGKAHILKSAYALPANDVVTRKAASRKERTS